MQVAVGAHLQHQPNCYRGSAAVLPLVLLALGSWLPVPIRAREPRPLPAEAVYGDFAVGVATGYAVDDRQRFDPWNSAYGRPEYRALLRQVESAGQFRTVMFQLWYPAPANKSSGRLAGPRSAYPATSGRKANYYDFYSQAGDMSRQIGPAVQALLPHFIQLRGGGTLADAENGEAILQDIGHRILDRFRGAWQDAWADEGRFPVVILVHGLAGSHGMWSSLGEFLASHGYVVAAPTFISDGGLPLVFHDQDSPFARKSSVEEVRRAYDLILGTTKVVPHFYRLLFGLEAGGFGPPKTFDPSTAKLVPGGERRVNRMMRNLFRQRVSDIALVLRTVRLLGAETATCRTALASMGATSAARHLCGILEARIDSESVGIAGHSLGSMTAQLAADHVPGIRTAIGLNNGPPYSWTPEEMLDADKTDEGLPTGSRKPVLLMIGDEDHFVQGVFIELLQSAVARAGGDPKLTFPLASERARPNRAENPQPVALSAWQRAKSDRALVIVRNTDHFTLTEDFARLFPWPEFQRGALPFGQTPLRTRKPTGAGAFGARQETGEPYTQLGWADSTDGRQVYWPHIVRDWYFRSWLDWHLKGDRAARDRLREPDPFGELTSARLELR